MTTEKTLVAPSDLDGSDFQIDLLNHKAQLRRTTGVTPVAAGDVVLVRQGGILKQIPASTFIPVPPTPIVPRLSPVLDFITAATLAPLVGSPGDRYIVSDGANQADIAMWDGGWGYYSPANGEYTTITTGTYATTQWFYDQPTDTWIQDMSPPLPPDPLPDQPLAGSVKLVSVGSRNGRRGHAVIVNHSLVTWGADPNTITSAGDDAEVRRPHRASWVWNRLTAPLSRNAQYTPIFTDAAGDYNTMLAVDSRGKLWAASITAAEAGLQGMSPIPSMYGLVPVPFFQALTPKITQLSFSSWNGHKVVCMDNGDVYSTGNNVSGQFGVGNTTATTTWVKMNMPAGKLAKRVLAIGALNYGMTLVLTAAGELYGCGVNNYSILSATAGNVTTPILITTDVKDFTSNSTSLWVVKNDGTMWVRGLNTNGQLGRGNLTNVTAALTQVAGITDAAKVFTYQSFYNYSCAAYLTTAGVVKFAGYHRYSMFGASVGAVNANISTFTAATFGGQGTVADVIVGARTVHVLTTSGNVWNCGSFVYRGTGKSSGSAAEDATWLQVSLASAAVGIRQNTYRDDGGTDPETTMALMSTGRAAVWGAGQGNAYGTGVMYAPQDVSFYDLYDGNSPLGNPPSLV